VEGTTWADPIKLNENINSPFLESSTSLSGDLNTLYFSSNREGGFGGKDIYMSRKLADGEWGEAENLGHNVNTEEDEDGPFIHPDGITLYFSSEGHNSMGGFDIFRSIRSGNDWTRAENIGYPINTADDDLYFTSTADGKRAYFSSARAGGYGNQDIFVVHTTEDFGKSPVLTLMKGIITADGSPVKSEITVIDNETSLVRGVYQSNSASGKYIIIIDPGGNYNIRFQTPGKLYSTSNINYPSQDSFISVIENIELQQGKKGEKVTLTNIFFDEGSSKLLSTSSAALQNLQTLLDQNPSLTIEIASYVDTTISNQGIELATQRAKAVATNLIENGIDPSRLAAKGYAISKQDENQNERVRVQILDGSLAKTFMGQIEMDRNFLPPSEELAMKDEFFGDGDAYLLDGATNKLEKIKDLLDENEDKQIELVYYIDPTIENQDEELAKERADVIASYLIGQGIDEDRIETSGYVIDPGSDDNKAKQRLVLNMYEPTIPPDQLKRADVFKTYEQIEEARKPVEEENIETEEDVKDEFTMMDLFFGEGSAELQEIPSEMDMVFDALAKNEGLSIEIDYYIDTKKEGHDLVLAQERAGALASYLIEKGIGMDRIVSKGYGIGSEDTGNEALERAEVAKRRQRIDPRGGADTDVETAEGEPQKPKVGRKRSGDNIVSKSIYFDYNRSTLRTQSQEVLRETSEFLANNPEFEFIVLGHTDSKGPYLYNQHLSQKRAYSVTKYAEGKGVKRGRMFSKGYGETRPAATNQNIQGRQLNRRAELLMINVDELSSDLNITTASLKSDASMIDKILELYSQGANKELIYRVQVGAYRNKPWGDVFSKIYDINNERFNDGLTRYTTGRFGTLGEAAKYKKELMGQGYHDAFVVAYMEGDRVNMKAHLSYKVQGTRRIGFRWEYGRHGLDVCRNN